MAATRPSTARASPAAARRLGHAGLHRGARRRETRLTPPIWQASADGGNAPRWSRDGKQLFYAKDDRLTDVEFREGAIPQLGSAQALPVNIASDRIFLNSYSAYAATADGGFITTQPVGDTQPTIHLVTNWNGIVGR